MELKLRQHLTLFNTKTIIFKEKQLNSPSQENLKEGDQCKVIAGTHKGKSGTVRDINTSKTGHITLTVVQENGPRFKTLGKNVVVVE